jgi:dihydrofolate reductase
MRELVLKMHVSVDGFVAGQFGEYEWIKKTQDQGVAAWLVNTVSEASLHLVGSVTFRTMAAGWPFVSGPIAAAMNERNRSSTIERQ